VHVSSAPVIWAALLGQLWHFHTAVIALSMHRFRV
jgi:hypothetical protein